MNKLNFSIMKRPSQIKGDNIPSFDELRWAGEGGAGGPSTYAKKKQRWIKGEKKAIAKRKARWEAKKSIEYSGRVPKTGRGFWGEVEEEIKKEIKKRALDIQEALQKKIQEPPSRDVSFDAFLEELEGLQGKLQRINEIISELEGLDDRKFIEPLNELTIIENKIAELELELGLGKKNVKPLEISALRGGAKQIEEGKEEWELSSDGKVRARQVEAEMTEDDKKEIMDLYDQWQAENPVSNALYKDEVLDFETSGKQSGLYWFVQGQLFQRELTKRNQEAKKEADKKAADKAAEDKALADKVAADKAAALAYQFDPTWVFRPIASINSDILKESDWEIWNNTYVQTANAYGLLAIFYGHGDTSTTHSEDFYHNTAKAFSSSGVTKMVGGVSAHDIFMFNIHEKFDAIIQDLQANQDYITSTDFYGNKTPTNFNDTSAWKNTNAQIKNLSAINANMKLATYFGIRNRKI